MLERFFAIMKACNGGKENPTCSSFLQLFRMISLYYATKTSMRVKGSNVDGAERLRVPTTFKDWLSDGYKKCKRENLEMKKSVKRYLIERT